MNIRPARVGDVPAIYELIRTFADRKLMIRRSMGELYESIREFLVAVDDENRVIGCVALHVFWEDLAELKCLAVSEDAQGQGVGRLLVDACWEAARELETRLGLRADLCRRLLRAVRLPSDRQGRAASQDLERMRALSALPELPGSGADSHASARAADGRCPPRISCQPRHRAGQASAPSIGEPIGPDP